MYVAHNAKFEQSFLARFDLRRPSEPVFVPAPTWVCTFKCALRIWPDFPAHNLQALRYQLGHARPFNMPREHINPHRADSDVLVTAAIVHDILRHARWSDLCAWSAAPALYTRLTFGQYKGRRFDEIARSDPGYLTWIITKSDMDEDRKSSADYWLKQVRNAA